MPPARCAPTPPCAAISCAATGSTGATAGHECPEWPRTCGRRRVRSSPRSTCSGCPASSASASTPTRRWPRTCGALEVYWDDRATRAGVRVRRHRQPLRRRSLLRRQRLGRSGARAARASAAGARPCRAGRGRCSGSPSTDGTPAPTRPVPGASSGWSRARGTGAPPTTTATSSPTPPTPSSDCTWPSWRAAAAEARPGGLTTRAPTTCTRGSTSPSTPAATAGAPGTGLFFDKLRGDGTIDETLWTYNQGSMIGANVLLARALPHRRERRRERHLPRPRGGHRRQGAAPLRRHATRTGRRPSTRSCFAICSSSTPPPPTRACASASATP